LIRTVIRESPISRAAQDRFMKKDVKDMNYQPMLYKEWVDDTQESVTAVAIRGNEAIIEWAYAGTKQLGQATSSDGLNYKGTFSEPGIPSGERGTFEFKLYALTDKGILLLGRFHSELTGEEREFLLEGKPNRT
jgi:hypothetical protein